MEINSQLATCSERMRMWRKPGERVIGQLEGRVEAILAGGCKQLTLWVYATLGRKPGERVMGQLDGGDIRGVQVVGDLKVVIMFSLPSLFGCGL